MEASCRLYTGLPDCFSAILACEGGFQLILVSELGDGNWIVTGLADDMEGRIMETGADGLPMPHPRIHLQSMDESLSKIIRAHKKTLGKAQTPVVSVPKNLEEALGALERFLTVAYSQELS